MAYVSPTSRVNLYVVDASVWNQDVVVNTKWLAEDKPRCRVYNSAAISVADSSRVALTFDSERFDVGGCHSTSSNTGRLTAPTAGSYLIGGSVSYAQNVTGIRDAAIRVNGATFIAVQKIAAITGTPSDVSVATMYSLSAGDYVELTVFQSSGGALNVSALSAYSPEFWMTWVGT